MKLCLISFYKPRDEFPTKYSLTSMRLASYVIKHTKTIVKILAFNLQDDINQIVIQIEKENPNLVGFSLYDYTLKKSIQTIKKLNENIQIVVGGPEVKHIHKNIWNKNVIMVKGEGEIALAEICKKITLKNYIFDENKIKNNNYKSVPTGYPLFSESFNKTIDKVPIFTWYETMRGCYFNCAYCGHRNNKGLNNFDLDFIKKEIINLKKNGIKSIFIIDPILGGTSKRTIKILTLFHDIAPCIQISGYYRAEFLSKNVLSSLIQGNIKKLFIGIQTTNPNVPKWIRNNNIKILQNNLPLLSKNHIKWVAELIVGLPGDTLLGLKLTLKYVVEELSPSIIFAYRLTVIKGTALYNILNKTNEDYWLQVDDNSFCISSNSYTYTDLKYMLEYSIAFTSLYNNFQEKNISYSFQYLDSLVSKHLNKTSIFNELNMDKARKYWVGI